MSIQLALDGHSFSVEGLSGAFEDGAPVSVEVLTPRTLLAPEELFDDAQAPELLAAAGLPLAGGERVVWSEAQEGVLAVMVVPEEALRTVREHFGDRVRFTTPLLAPFMPVKPTVRLHRIDGLLYIKVYDTTLRLAEVIPATVEADILYFFGRLTELFSLRNYRLQLSGENTKAMRKLLKDLFRETLCE